MPKATGDPTPITTRHNDTASYLADELGGIKADMADLKAREDALKAELISRGLPEAEGVLFRATVTEATRWTLDTDRVKAEFGEAWYAARCKVGTVTTVRVSARTGNRQAA